MNAGHDDLIQRVLDGDASAEERLQLDALLAADAGVRQRHEEQSEVFRILGAARMVDAPAGLRDDVLTAVRAAGVPGHNAAVAHPHVHSHLRPPVFSWLRLALPAVATVLAVTILWINRTALPWTRPGDQVSGTMSGAVPTDALRLGTGRDAVVARLEREEHGFVLRLQTGEAPARLEIEAASADVRLGLHALAPGDGGLRVEQLTPAHTTVLVYGVARGRDASLDIRATFESSRTVTGRMPLDGFAEPHP